MVINDEFSEEEFHRETCPSLALSSTLRNLGGCPKPAFNFNFKFKCVRVGHTDQNLGLPPKPALRSRPWASAHTDQRVAVARPFGIPALFNCALPLVGMDMFQRVLFIPQNVAAARFLRYGLRAIGLEPLAQRHF